MSSPSFFDSKIVQKCTVVDAHGKVLREGTGGVIIVSSDDSRDLAILMHIDEVSDADLFNLFISIPERASLFKSECGGNEVAVALGHESLPKPGTTQYELMLGVKE